MIIVAYFWQDLNKPDVKSYFEPTQTRQAAPQKMSAEELKIEDDLSKKHYTDSKEPQISALVAVYRHSGILYPRQYLERKIQYKVNVGKTREQAIEELCKEESLRER